MGPFVSENHPDIVNATMDLTPEEILQKQVTPHLSKLAEQCPGTQLVIIPHANDIIHEYPVIPQPPLPQSLLKLDNVLTLSNPAIIDINGTTLALGNTDILMNISREEISKYVAYLDLCSGLMVNNPSHVAMLQKTGCQGYYHT